MISLPTHLAVFGADALAALLVFAGPGDRVHFVPSITVTPPADSRLIGIVGVFATSGGKGAVRGCAADDKPDTLRLMAIAGQTYLERLRHLGLTERPAN